MADSGMSADHPYPVRQVSQLVSSWIDRLGEAWVEGEITQLKRRPGAYYSYFSLRDLEDNVSLQVTCPSRLLVDAVGIEEGSRVIVHGDFKLYAANGSLSLIAKDLRPAGLGELLARLEQLRQKLASEGLFATEHKKPLPFLPHNIGLITGRNSAAERDVLSVSRNRWPNVNFTVHYASMQGKNCVPEVMAELAALDADPEIDVIIIARGGGSMEDLLPFSDESLARAVFAAHTPVVSAIGHEPDTPILDYVADLRAATPTDAAKRVVPDVAQELALVSDLRNRNVHALHRWVTRERDTVSAFLSRPVMSTPVNLITDRLRDIDLAREHLRRTVTLTVANEDNTIATALTQLEALGPQQTLARGYAVVQVMKDEDVTVVSSVHHAPLGSHLRVRLHDGALQAEVTSSTANDDL